MSKLFPELDRNKFADGFLDAYVARGFGALPKKEIDLLVFTLMTQGGAFGQSGPDIQQISLALKIPANRVKTLVYEMGLRSGQANEDSWFRERLFHVVHTTRFIPSQSRIEFGVEDPLLRSEIEGRLKRKGHFPDYSFSKDILKIDLEGFGLLLSMALDENEQKAITAELIKKGIGKDSGENSPPLFKSAVRGFVLAVAKGAGDQISRNCVDLSFDFLTGGSTLISGAIKTMLGEGK